MSQPTSATLTMVISRVPAWLLAGVAAICLSFVLAMPHSAHAASCTFASVGTSDFNTSGNWSCGHIPNSADDVTIPATTSTNVSATTTILSLTLAASDSILTNGAGGHLTVSGVTSNAGQMTNNWIMVFNGTTTNSGTITNTAGKTIDFNGDVVNSGTIDHSAGGSISFAGTWNNVGGTYSAGASGTLTFDGSGIQTFPTNITNTPFFYVNKPTSTLFLFSTVTSTFFQIDSGTFQSGSSTYIVSGNVSLTGGTVAMSGAGIFNVGGNWSNTGGTLTSGFVSEVRFTGTGTQTISAEPNFNFLRINKTSGTAVMSGNVTSVVLTLVTTLDLGSNTFTLTGTGTGGSRSFLGAGSLISSGGTFKYAGNGTTDVNNTVYGSSVVFQGTGPYNITASTTVTGNVTIQSAATVSQGGTDFHVGGNWLDVPNSYTGASGATVYFDGTGSQTISNTSNFEDVIIKKNSGTASLLNEIILNGNFTIASGTFSLNGQAINVAGNWEDTGTLTGTGFVYLNGSSPQTVSTEPNFYDLFITSPGGVTLLGNVTTTHSLTVFNSGSSLDLDGFNINDPGTLTNNGTITLSGGHIIHPATLSFTSISGGTISSYTAGQGIFVTLDDGNRNLLGGSVETVTTTVTSAAGDSELITLTETSASSGIFRNGNTFFLVSASTIVPSNGQLDATAAGSVSTTYADNQDASDTPSATMPFSLTGSSGGGGGGSGAGGLPASGGGGLPPVVTTYQSYTYLQNLQNMGIAIHSLIKLPNDGNAATQADSAVYYVGMDGMRHAFPNDKVYFTWYADFSGVQIVNATQLASIPLGKNVTYKPGVKMVKFTTDNKVYAVQKGGVLRWVKTQDVAIALYGSAWNAMIDDINDAFYVNYQFGADISSASDYSPSAARASVVYPSDSLQP